MSYKKFFKARHYTYTELLAQIAAIKKAFPGTKGTYRNNKVCLSLKLKPTPQSIEYTIKLNAKKGSEQVNIFVVNPKISLTEHGKLVPHLYSNGALCLYYPKYKELKCKDYWSETLIPWTCLWLFYYEIWKETGEWLGGGIHRKKVIAYET